MLEFRGMTEPLAAWLDQCTVLGSGLKVPRKKLLAMYNAYAESSGRPPMTAKAFCADVRRHRPTIIDTQRSVGGETQWVFLGIGMDNPSQIPSHTTRQSQGGSD